jgi:hypothetical protein
LGTGKAARIYFLLAHLRVLSAGEKNWRHAPIIRYERLNLGGSNERGVVYFFLLHRIELDLIKDERYLEELLKKIFLIKSH